MPPATTNLRFYLLKLPLLLILMLSGFILEFFLQLPFHIMCTRDRIGGRQR
jgi:hypothetical protein